MLLSCEYSSLSSLRQILETATPPEENKRCPDMQKDVFQLHKCGFESSYCSCRAQNAERARKESDSRYGCTDNGEY